VSRNLRAGLVVLVVAVVVGAAGYIVIEGLSVVDAAYMAVITISTVGFAEVGGPLSAAGRLWTMAVLISGMGAALYTAFLGVEYLAETAIGGQRQQRKMERAIADLEDHVVLCGFGRVGRTAWQALIHEEAEVVIIDVDPERVEAAMQMGAKVIEGDATSDELLELAGLRRARVVIPAVSKDSDNLVITLSAKAINPAVLVVARAFSEESEKKLYLAGADRVVAPQLVGGQRLATLAMRPNLAEFIDFVVGGRTLEFQVEEFTVSAGSSIVGRTLREIDLRRVSGALVLAVGEAPGKLSLNPDPDHIFSAGELVIGVGTTSQLVSLRQILS
jgi:voltage-gated potassium channel